jgi:hypothetical protein
MHKCLFFNDLRITSISRPRPKELKWPSDENEWRDLLSTIYTDSNFDRQSKFNIKPMEATMCTKVIKKEPQTVHCECLLLAHLHEFQIPSPFTYLAVSKLSCKPCFYFLQAYNSITGNNFQTRGSHDKWCSGWARPCLTDEQLQVKVDEKFVSLIEEELCEMLLKEDRSSRRRESDRSASSEKGITSFDTSQEEGMRVDSLALEEFEL